MNALQLHLRLTRWLKTLAHLSIWNEAWFPAVWTMALLAMASPSAAMPLSGQAWPLGIEPAFHLPEAWPFTNASVQLGRRLFFDKRLSRDQRVSCASCHVPEKGFSNGLKVGVGVFGQLGERNVPTIVNRLLGQEQFWDGRAKSLEDQVLGPLLSPKEMAMDEQLLLKRIRADPLYLDLFREVYDAPPNLASVASAIASFERTLMSGGSAFDHFEWGGERSAMSDSAKRGLRLFRGKAGCSTCHLGTNFTDEKFHNIGAGEGVGAEDPGRMAISGDPADSGKFKTPTLRNLLSTAPYMHDGSLSTLKAVLDFYDRGGRPNPNLDKEIKALSLTEREKADLIEFLRSLTGPIVSVDVAELRRQVEP